MRECNHRTGVLRFGTLAVLAVGALGCSARTTATAPAPGTAFAPPHVFALSTYEASLGTVVDVIGENFPNPEDADTKDAKTSLYFEGHYLTDNGGQEPVKMEFPLERQSQGEARWTNLGPYTIPFLRPGARNDLGEFQGTIAARVRTPGKSTIVEDPNPTQISFRIKPSVVITEMQPSGANCARPVERIIGGLPYRIRVEALGFRPKSFSYAVNTPALNGTGVPQDNAINRINRTRPATGPFDVVGDGKDDEFVFPDVPPKELAYGTIFTVTAEAQEGGAVQNSFAINVHRPIELFYNGNLRVAEIFEPSPITSCMPGGINGAEVSWNNATSETRNREYDTRWDDSWLTSVSASQAIGESDKQEVTNSVRFTVIENETVETEIGGQIGLPIGLRSLVPLTLRGSISNSTEEGSEDETASSEGVTEEKTTTDTETAGKERERSQSDGFSWSVDSSEAITRDYKRRILPRTSGVFYRQTQRVLRRMAIVSYNLCGIPASVGEVDFTDWLWGPDMAQGEQCPPFPKSNLPAARCIIPPCQVSQ